MCEEAKIMTVLKIYSGLDALNNGQLVFAVVYSDARSCRQTRIQP
jgi:hypothetical protein